MKHVYLSWYDLEDLVTRLLFKLDTPYDAILVITRGGIIPGGMIAEALKMKEVLTAAVIFASDDTKGAQALAWPTFQQFPGDALLAKRKILVVDNLWYQGRTAIAVKGRIEAAGGFPEVAVLHWKSNSSLYQDLQPDYFVETTEDFIHYPWQRIDDSDYRVPAQPVMPLS